MDASYFLRDDRFARMGSHLPGGSNHTAKEAVRWALMDGLHLFIEDDYDVNDHSVTIRTTDCLDKDKLRNLFNVEIVRNGKVFQFDYIEPRAYHHEGYGGPTTDYWNEIVYRIVR